MDELIENLLGIDSVKAVKRQSDDVLKIELFSREIPNSELVEIRGDLRTVTPTVRSKLENARESGEINGWSWIVRPEKKYQSTSLGRDKVSDRKAKGYRPGHYRVNVK
ncbi:hypothetical protein [Candidatus Nanohalococcus occultus]|uniref:hypothetical protein n=1 Tax=Candidatus Nanohalococcus occultus TaxID=2978047 RepID=UPI0039E08A60